LSVGSIVEQAEGAGDQKSPYVPLEDQEAAVQHTLSIEYGDELLFNLSMSPEQFSEEAKLLLAAKLYELGKLTTGQAARFCGRGRVDFLLALSRLGVPAANLRPEDAALELEYGRNG
jgi:predicted HTH domain antitoxin